jgi:hypothetical protein
VVVVVVVVVARRVHRPSPGRRRPATTADDEADSLFTWAHLAAQLRGLVSRMVGRLVGRFRRRRRSVPPAPGPVPAGRLGDGDGVRAAYRRLLVAARSAGQGRRPIETTRELASRLSGRLGAEPSAALAQLTEAYDAVRYGELEADALTRIDVGVQADLVSGALGRPDGSPAAPPAGRG